MTPEKLQHMLNTYQQMLADTQLQLAAAHADLAELRAAQPAPEDSPGE